MEGLIEIDFSSQTIVRARAEALTACFDTGDPERNRAMADYMQVTTYPRASIEMTACRELVRLDDTRFRAAVTAELNFVGKRQYLPLTFYINMSQASFEVEMDFRWSFKDHGLKAPSLLFLKVRDHVDIRGKGVFVPGPADDGPAS